MLSANERKEKVSVAIEIAIKVGLLGIVLYVSFMIFKPFLAMLLWGIILAVALSPLVNILEKRFGHRKKVIILIAATFIIALMVPTFMLSGQMIETGQTLAHTMQDGNITIPPPTEKVKEWPLIGEKAYNFWNSASHDLQKTLAPFARQITGAAGSVFSAIGSGLGTIFIFVGSLIIAAAFLMSSDASVKLYRSILHRLIGGNSGEWAQLSALTIRSVVTGVIGVAVIQSVFAFIGMAMMDVPFAAVLALVIMFLTIIQAPALLVTAPVIAYVFSQGTGTTEIIFAIYMLIVSVSDGVLKPMLMGRGVDIPMLVILIGAIGGMILMGMIGLFIGAVIFALAYKLFGLWMSEADEEAAAKDA